MISQFQDSFHIQQLSFYSKEEPFPLLSLSISIADPWIPILFEHSSVLITKMPQIAKGETLQAGFSVFSYASIVFGLGFFREHFLNFCYNIGFPAHLARSLSQP